MAWSDAARAAARLARQRRRSSVHRKLVSHPLFGRSDYKYLRKKGYTKTEVLKLWDRDSTGGMTTPVVHKKPFDLVGYLNRGKRG